MVQQMLQQLFGDNKTGKRVDPFASFKFHVEIDGIEEGAFTECSGIEVSTEVFEYREGGLNEFSHKLPGVIKHSNITLKRGYVTSNEVYNWFAKMEQSLIKGEKITRKPVTIKLYSAAKFGETISWVLNDAFPVKWVGPSLKAGEAAVAVETIEFAHHGIIPSRGLSIF